MVESASFLSRIKNAWNVFRDNEEHREEEHLMDVGPSYYTRPDRRILSTNNERTIINAIINRVAMDVATCTFKHVRVDENDNFIEEIDSGINDCLNLEANIDQTGRAFIQDIVMTMLDEGVVAVVPCETNLDPRLTTGINIQNVRTGKVVEWMPYHVKVRTFNVDFMRYDEVMYPKANVAIIENPLYSIMNDKNSVLRRLVRKMNLMDVIDDQQGSGKLDLIMQMPYQLKSESRKDHAETRLKEIENQLTGSKFGIAYTDATEKIVQLNRPVENNLLKEVENLQNTLYAQLGITEEILNGSAADNVMNNYYNRTVEPIASAITDEFKRKFLTRTAISQRQTFKSFRDPFKLVPVTQMAELADKFTRNEIMTSNELRQVIGLKPSLDPRADQLRNKNINEATMDPSMQYDVDGNPMYPDAEYDDPEYQDYQ